jgi:hypothetical protein
MEWRMLSVAEAAMRPATLAEVARRRNAGEELASLLVGFLDSFYGDLRKRR